MASSAPPPPSRVVHHADALDWLRDHGRLDGSSVVTSLPDISEVPHLGFEGWRRWFEDTAKMTMESVPDEGAVIFFQSDVRHAGLWVDKGFLVSRAAERAGMATLFHRIVCREPPGTETFGSATYAHLLGFARVIGPARPRAAADVIPDGGFKPGKKAMGVSACLDACRFIESQTSTRTVVDPFCGFGTVLAVANAIGLHAVGVDLRAYVPPRPLASDRAPGDSDTQERLVSQPSTSADSQNNTSFRAVCERCRRPEVVCYCAHIPTLPTRTRILLLQHPRERRMGIGTAHMAHLALPNSIVRVAVDFALDPVVRAILDEPPPSLVALLFPGPDARDVASLPPDRALTLVVLDGTWSQARSLLRANPALAALPRVAFSPRKPSDYRIRRQPAEVCVSTIEALAEVLSIIEPPGPAFERLLEPFQAMVKRQEYFAAEVNCQRHRPAATARSRERRPGLDARLQALWPRLVCVQGEANAWAMTDPARQEPEIVHWVAHRPASGETYEAVVAPRRPLGPATPAHVGLPIERLLGGVDAGAWRASWRGFLREDDILLVWGVYYAGVAVADGLPLSLTSSSEKGTSEVIDVREEITRFLQERVGVVERCVERLKGAPAPLGLAGRGGRRLSALVGVVQALNARQTTQ